MSIGPVDIEFVMKGDIAARMKQVGSTIKGEAGAMNTQMQQLGKNTNIASSQLNKLKGLATGLLPVASVAAAGLAFKRLATDIYNFSNQYSMAMREVQTISTAVQEDFEGISKAILDLSAQSPDGAIELAQAYYQIVSAGRDGAEGLELLKIASQSATAGVTDTKTAADGLTTVLNAWGKSTDEAGKVADILFKTVERGKTTFPELSRNISTVAPLAASMNVSLEEVTAAIATLTKQGVPTAQAMTQIRSSLVNLNKALGDGWSETLTYQEALQKVAEMAGGSQTELRKLIPDIEGMSAVLGQTGEKALEASKDLEAMENATGSMVKGYTAMMLEADNKWSLVHNKWNRELSALGGTLKEASIGAADFFNAMLTGIEDMPDDLPLITNIDDRIAAFRLMGNSMAESYIKAVVTTFNNSGVETQLANMIGEAKVGFGEKNTELAGILGIEDAQERAEHLNLFLEKMKQERTTDFGLFAEGDKKGEVAEHLRTKYWDDLFKRIQDGLNVLKEEDSPAAIIQEQVIADAENMQEELKRLHEEILTADETQQKKIAERIVELQKELALRMKIADEAIRAARNAAGGSDVVPEQMKPITGNIDKEQKSIKKVVSETTLEVDKLNKKIEDNKNKVKQWLTDWSAESMEKFMSYASQVTDMTEYMIDKYREQLGLTQEQANVMQGMLRLTGGIADIASGNYVQGAAKLIEATIELFVKVPEAMSVQFVALQEHVDKVLQSIDVASRTMLNLGDGEVLTALGVVNAQLTGVAESAKKLNEELGQSSYGRRRGTTTIYRELADDAADLEKEIDKLTQRLLQGNISDDQRKAIEAVLESYNALLTAIDDITRDLTGTTVNELADSLSEAFLVGTDAAEQWGAAVDDIIKHVITKQLTSALIAGPVQEAIDKLIADTEGGLTTDEAARFKETIESLAESVGPAFEEARAALESIGIDMGSEGATSNAAVGAIRALTEETGGMIYGMLMGIRYDIKDIIKNSLANDEDMALNLSYMAEIAANTRHNRKLNDIDTKLGEMNTYLKNI